MRWSTQILELGPRVMDALTQEQMRPKSVIRQRRLEALLEAANRIETAA